MSVGQAFLDSGARWHHGEGEGLSYIEGCILSLHIIDIIVATGCQESYCEETENAWQQTFHDMGRPCRFHL